MEAEMRTIMRPILRAVDFLLLDESTLDDKINCLHREFGLPEEDVHLAQTLAKCQVFQMMFGPKR